MKSNFSKLDQEIVRAYVRKLPQKEKKVLIMRFWENLSLSEISAALRTPLDEVEARLNRAMGILKEDCLELPIFSKASTPKLNLHSK